MLPGRLDSDSEVTVQVLSSTWWQLSPVLVNHKSYEEIMDSIRLAV